MRQMPLVLWSQKPFWRTMVNGKWAQEGGGAGAQLHLLHSFLRGGTALGEASPIQRTRIRQPCMPVPHQPGPPNGPVRDPTRPSADSHPHFASNIDSSKPASLQTVFLRFFIICQEQNGREDILRLLCHRHTPLKDKHWPRELLLNQQRLIRQPRAGRVRLRQHCRFPFTGSVNILAILKYYFPL